jgi:hypothetical protein
MMVSMKMNARIWTRACVVLGAVALAGLAGCSSDTPASDSASAPTPPGAATASASAPANPSAALGAPYRSPDGYFISPPAGWALHPVDPRSGVSVVFAATTLDKAAAKPFADNLNVVITPESRPLDAVVAETKAKYPTIVTNYQVVTDQPVSVQGQPAHLIGGTYADERSGALENIQLVVVNGGKMYSVTFTTPAASFDKFHEAMNASLGSFGLG